MPEEKSDHERIVQMEFRMTSHEQGLLMVDKKLTELLSDHEKRLRLVERFCAGLAIAWGLYKSLPVSF